MNFISKSLIIYSKIFPYIKRERKLQIFISIFISIFVSIFESLGIGSLFPFIASLIDPDKIYNINFIKNILIYFNVDKSNLSIIFGSTFILLVLLSSILKIVLLKINTNISYSLIAEIGLLMFTKIVNQSYISHLKKNSSDTVTSLAIRANCVGETTFFLINIINSLLFVIFITLTILIISPFSIINIIILLFLFYFSVFLIFRRKIKSNSLNITRQSGNLIKMTQETIGSIREIIIYKISNIFLKKFNEANFKFRQALGSQVFISAVPSHILQGLILISAILFAYYLNSIGKLIDLVPVLTAIILAIQRLFPNIQTIFASFTTISGLEGNLKETSDILTHARESKNKLDYKKKLPFNDVIEFKNVCFSYSDDETFKVDNVEFSIKKGSKVGIKGTSGGGKSTIVDLLIGLLKPVSGEILLDKHKLDQNSIHLWHEKIAFVSQNIFLTDESILKNICISEEEKNVDIEKINKVLKDVNLFEYVSKLPNGINTLVGERGSNLSGGQIQRVGIARALIKKREVIILDEATNAIDRNNEEIIMENLGKIKGLTLIIVSHDDYLLNKCDQVFQIENGRLTNVS